ncbi:MAG: N-6 DNA methylase [Endomicrobium sp.]|jgi:type I restriction-modification system DNA methylase subunit|nr:N-6 DNA methylase [Endomicrobium sp.]
MSEELLQTSPFWLGRYAYYRLGSTTLNQLKKAKIINKISKGLADKKPDGLIVLPGGIVKAIVEYKSPKELLTKLKIRAAIVQELEVAKLLCKVLIVTDGSKTFWINALNGSEITRNGKKVSAVFDANKIINNSMTVEERIDIENLIDQAEYSLTESSNDIFEPKILDPTPLAKEVWQKIWINTGKEPEKCLYNVVEIFVFKFLSDIGVLNYTNNFNSVYQIKEKIDDASALKHYANSCRKTIKEDMFPSGEDGTTIFNGTIFINEKGEANLSQATLFGQVLDSFQRYDEKNGSFKYVTKEFKTRLYETFLRQSAGVKNLGQYFTPRTVIQSMVAMSNAKFLNEGARICDPFCGVGGFILEAIAMTPGIYKQFEPRNEEINPKITLLGFDKGTDEKDDERTIILAKANMLIYFSDLLSRYHSTNHLKSFASHAFNKVFHLIKTNLGTFGLIKEKEFDLILTNPPYVTTGSSTLKDSISDKIDLKKFYDTNGRGTEALAITWIIKKLKKGGQALIIVPDGLMMQENMIQFILKNSIVQGIISLPVRTFYTTNKKTYILILKKKEENITQTSPVFIYLVSEIGETRDVHRFFTEENNLNEAVSLFNLFKSNNKVPNSKRCKIVDFKEFEEMQNWLIDRIWTDDEKKDMGIAEEGSEITEDEFIEIAKNIQTELELFYKALEGMDDDT